MNLHRRWALIAVVLLMITWGSTFVVTKAAVQEIPAFTLGALRFLTGGLVLLPLAIARGGLSVLSRPLPHAWLVGMALTGIALFVTGFNFALRYGTASQGALVYALVPAAVAAAAYFILKEKQTKRRVAGIALSICGVMVVVMSGEIDVSAPNPVLGACWMLVAVLAWTTYTIVAKRFAAADQIVVITYVSIVGAAMLLPFACWELVRVPWREPSLHAWLGVLFLGVVASALAYVVYGWALRRLDASVVGTLSNLDPMVGVLTGIIFLGEKMSAGQVIGGIVALAGMWLASHEPRNEP